MRRLLGWMWRRLDNRYLERDVTWLDERYGQLEDECHQLKAQFAALDFVFKTLVDERPSRPGKPLRHLASVTQLHPRGEQQ